MFDNWHQSGKINSQKRVYQGPVFAVDQLQINTPDGLKVERDLIHTDPTITILAITDDNQVALTSEYRVGINADSVSLPAGIINPGESPEAAAKREFKEETGFSANSAEVMTTITSSEGFMDQTAALVLIKFNTDSRTSTHFDSDEYVSTQLVDMQKVLDWLKAGKINTAQGLAAVSFYQLFIA